MKKKLMQLKLLALTLAFGVALSGCSTTKVAKDWNGVGSPDGTPLAHVSTSNVAMHLLMGQNPTWGNASLDKTVSDFTAAAKAQGASKVHIVQSNSTSWWFIFFPFSLLVTPVTSNVAGDAIA